MSFVCHHQINLISKEWHSSAFGARIVGKYTRWICGGIFSFYSYTFKWYCVLGSHQFVINVSMVYTHIQSERYCNRVKVKVWGFGYVQKCFFYYHKNFSCDFLETTKKWKLFLVKFFNFFILVLIRFCSLLPWSQFVRPIRYMCPSNSKHIRAMITVTVIQYTKVSPNMTIRRLN